MDGGDGLYVEGCQTLPPVCENTADDARCGLVGLVALLYTCTMTDHAHKWTVISALAQCSIVFLLFLVVMKGDSGAVPSREPANNFEGLERLEQSLARIAIAIEAGGVPAVNLAPSVVDASVSERKMVGDSGVAQELRLLRRAIVDVGRAAGHGDVLSAAAKVRPDTAWGPVLAYAKARTDRVTRSAARRKLLFMNMEQIYARFGKPSTVNVGESGVEWWVYNSQDGKHRLFTVTFSKGRVIS